MQSYHDWPWSRLRPVFSSTTWTILKRLICLESTSANHRPPSSNAVNAVDTKEWSPDQKSQELAGAALLIFGPSRGRPERRGRSPLCRKVVEAELIASRTCKHTNDERLSMPCYSASAVGRKAHQQTSYGARESAAIRADLALRDAGVEAAVDVFW